MNYVMNKTNTSSDVADKKLLCIK